MCSNFQIVIDTHSLAQDDLGKDMNAIPAPTRTVEILISFSFINIAKHSNRIIYGMNAVVPPKERVQVHTYVQDGTEQNV